MKSHCLDTLEEYRDLERLCESLSETQWSTKSDFYEWTPWDEIAHLCYFDETALLSATSPDGFAKSAQALAVELAKGVQISAVARQHFSDKPGSEILPYWRATYESLIDALSRLDPKDRLPWYGPSMSARSFATARLMETWAHGQDIWDVLRKERPATPRLKHIAHIGVSTFGWTFINRRLPVPEITPYVSLTGCDGDVWNWGTPSDTHFVVGSATDFCLTVTQRRHVDDTSLQLGGDIAKTWMQYAQCFAGPPVQGPPPGVRKR